MILVVDNYDSFTFNRVQALMVSGAELEVVRNDVLDRAALADRLAEDGPRRIAGIVVSPGPGNPGTAGVSVAAVELAAERALPLLGVCLGHQCIAAAFGAGIVRAPSLVHGEASQVRHTAAGVLAGLPSPFPAGRYHSLCVDEATLPPELEVTARTDDGVIMAMRHATLPLEGVQFHPESVLTPEGPRILANFLRLVGEGSAAVLDSDEGVGFATHGLRQPAGAAGSPR
ncbi:MAG TPA: aminodeoxychorismate/anthranilate synthase component II [Candidatus Limnocylindrales bacterium]|nr:aminodeoxychorismate/anthranilate synthase component II [Candidatus Limnocylindrales bacterium]